MRPERLTEVARLVAAGESFDICLAYFLDEFHLSPKLAALEAKPVLLWPAAGELGRVQDAYLAATAEELARAFGLAAPAWIGEETRKLHRPWFVSPLASLRAVLLQESPAGFRARILFVSQNVLSWA